MTTTAEQRKQERATRAAKLQHTIDLVTAMFWNLECGEALSPEQIVACQYDPVLGVLWWRIWDYAEYMSRTRPLPRAAHTDDTSRFIEHTNRQISIAIRRGERAQGPVHELRAAALAGHPKALALRRRQTQERPQ